MAATLADSLEVVLPGLPTALVPAEARTDIMDLARQLAPISRCGFEVRLGPSSEVDFQQGVAAPEGEVQKLRSHLSRSAGNGVAWGRLDDLLAEWDDASSPLQTGIANLWLEFDRPPAAALSVFVGFPGLPAPAADRLLVACRSLDILLGPGGWSQWQAALERCFDACPDGAFVSHLGLMIGRPSPVLRLNVKDIEPDQLGRYLSRVGYGGEIGEPVELSRRLRPQVDSLTVCLDLGSQLRKRLGFECFIRPGEPVETRWKPFLDWLVAEGWCAADKRDALLTWPLSITPDDVDRWPSELVGAGLRRPADHFTLLERRLSHVKVAYEPGRPIEAKGYFGLLHHWHRPGRVRDVPALNGSRRPTRGGADPVAGATEFLLGARTRAGWWEDFSGTFGATDDWVEGLGWSDEWVTAFVGTALAATRDPRALGACRRAWDLLVERRTPSAGWGYRREHPADADSTAWGLQLAAATGTDGSTPARRARQVLERNELPDGGVSTYYRLDRIHPSVGRIRSPDGSNAGWCSTSHACVTAAAVLAGHGRSREFLRQAQRADGSWAAYWWDDDAYATALAAEALATTGRPDDRRRVESAVGWAAERIGEDGSVDGSPFATAWCVRALRLAGERSSPRDQHKRAVAWLVDHQEQDGSWAASALLLAPRPDVTDVDSLEPPASTLDENRTFTTATVLSALAGIRG